MQYHFDQEIDRSGTNATKWEFVQSEEDVFRLERTDRFFGQDRALPMWVADMDFVSPRPVIEALAARVAHGIFGYSSPGETYLQAIVDWMRRRQGWDVSADSIVVTPGVVPALCMLVQTFTRPGDSVLIQPPVYYPFTAAIERNGAQVVRNSLVLEGGRYRMDFEDLEKKAADPRVKMAILCSPHNPVGRVWERDELRRFAEICLEHEVLIVSDEIHGDLIFPGHTFTPLGALGEAILAKSITCTAPSKTFNLAGLHTSNLILPNKELRSRFEATLQRNGLSGVNPMGLVALEAAYAHGEDWLDQVLGYLQGNLDFLKQTLEQDIPQIRLIEPEGTYLAWLDCRALGLDKLALRRLMVDQARVSLDEGFIFGTDGEGFERLNFACPRPVLAEALGRIRQAVGSM